MIVLEAILILCWVGMAAWHAHLIKHDRPIEHGWWGLVAAFLIVSACWLYGNGHPLWQIGLFALAQGCMRLAAFNIFLNLFRGDPWDYVSTKTTSILDKIEYRLFKQKVWILESIVVGVFFFIQKHL